MQHSLKERGGGQQFAALTRDDESKSWKVWLSTASDTQGGRLAEDGMSSFFIQTFSQLYCLSLKQLKLL